MIVGEPAKKQGVVVMTNGFGADGALSRIAHYTMQLLWAADGAH